MLISKLRARFFKIYRVGYNTTYTDPLINLLASLRNSVMAQGLPLHFVFLCKRIIAEEAKNEITQNACRVEANRDHSHLGISGWRSRNLCHSNV